LADGEAGELLNNAPELSIAAAAEDDNPSLATLLGNGAGSGQGLNAGWRGEAIAVVAELGQQSWGKEVSGSGQGIENVCIGVL
jgi:hypothetical protein